MFSLRDTRFVLCSRDLEVLRAQRIIGFLYLDYPQINEVVKAITWPCINLLNPSCVTTLYIKHSSLSFFYPFFVIYGYELTTLLLLPHRSAFAVAGKPQT